MNFKLSLTVVNVFIRCIELFYFPRHLLKARFVEGVQKFHVPVDFK